MLLYIGAQDDIWPFIRFAAHHKEFIYVDLQPSVSHYRPGERGYGRFDTIEKIYNALIDRLEADGVEVKKDATYYDEEKGYAKFVTHTDHTIHYFFNLADVDLGDSVALAPYLKQVKAVYVSGFSPQIRVALPSLKRIYHTPNCAACIEAWPLVDLSSCEVTELDELFNPYNGEDCLYSRWEVTGECSECDEYITFCI